MTAAEMRRLLLILHRERQKGFLAWQQLRRFADDRDPAHEGRATTSTDASHQLVPFPVAGRSPDES